MAKNQPISFKTGQILLMQVKKEKLRRASTAKLKTLNTIKTEFPKNHRQSMLSPPFSTVYQQVFKTKICS